MDEPGGAASSGSRSKSASHEKGATRVLVTGAGGFIGRHCVAALAAAGHDVVALGRSGERVPGAIEAIACDLLDPAATRAAMMRARAQCLVHLAWHADPRDRWHTPWNIDWEIASLQLARGFAAAGGVRMVFGGSSAEYDWSFETLDEESTPLRPATLYGAAKLSTGMTLSAAAPALGIEFAWARIFFCYGPGEPSGRLVSDLVSGLAAGRRVPCSDGLQQRDFLHAADVGAALALIAGSDLEGPVNVASGETVAVRAVIEEVAAILDRRALVDLGALPRAAGDPPRLAAVTGRLRALGFRPNFDLPGGLCDTVKAFLADAPR